MAEKTDQAMMKEVVPTLAELDREKTGYLAEAVHESTAIEHELGTWEAIQVYKPAVLWSLVYSMCVIMEGYDNNLLSNFFAYPSFLIKYGHWVGVTDSTPVGYQCKSLTIVYLQVLSTYTHIAVPRLINIYSDCSLASWCLPRQWRWFHRRMSPQRSSCLPVRISQSNHGRTHCVELFHLHRLLRT